MVVAGNSDNGLTKAAWPVSLIMRAESLNLQAAPPEQPECRQ